MKIIIFGTGSVAEKALRQINDTIKILAVSDNNMNKWGERWNGHKVINPSEISKYEYDYIIICSMYSSEIVESLIQKGIERAKIILYINNLDWQNQIKKEVEIKKIIFKQHKNKKIALLTGRNSGCNCRALYKNMPEHIKNDFEVFLLDYEEYESRWEDFEVLFTTNLEGRFYKNRINFETWHGFPIKSLGAFEKDCTDNLDNVNDGIDYIISYSNLYTYIMSSVFKIDINKFISTGMPRNDFLINIEARNLLSQMIKRDLINKQVIMYVPTFRKRMDKNVREGSNVVSDIQDLEVIDKYMGDHNSYFLVKKHPVEGDLATETNFENIFFLSDEDFQQMDIDFYEVLGGSDLLITDYSSVYFDYLLLDKPLIFWTKDQEMYEEKRGFLFEHVDKMMPGPNVKTVEELINVLDKFMKDTTWYSIERKNIKELVHTYVDFNSSERAWNALKSIYNK